jgi:hypothetical protein
MRFGANTLGQSIDENLNLLVRERCGVAVETHEPDHAGHLQYPQAVLQIEVDENVPWEKHQVEFLPAVFPSANAAIHRQEAVDMALF